MDGMDEYLGETQGNLGVTQDEARDQLILAYAGDLLAAIHWDRSQRAMEDY